MSDLKERFLSEYVKDITSDMPVPACVGSEYQIIECLKDRPDKKIYLIKSKKDGNRYILKCFSPACGENPAEEYEMLCSLSHPGLSKAVDFITFDGWSFIIREYFSGITLEELVEKNEGLSVEQSVNIVLELCDIINYLHSQNPPVIHRDIKPQNIIIMPDGSCRLIDLGIARRYRQEELKDTVFMGTQATAAPEQFGYMQTDVRTDVYSVGVLLFYLITGRFNVRKLDMYVIPKSVKRVITKCTSFSPDDRFASVLQLQVKLEKYKKAPKLTKEIGAFALAAILCLGFFMLGSSVAKTKKPDSTAKVTFTSPLIEKAVRTTLGKSEKDVIKYSDLDEIKQLFICGDTVYNRWNDHDVYGNEHYLNGKKNTSKGDITSLKDIKMMHNIQELALYNQKITDISEFDGLKLVKLGIGGNSIYDISELSKHTELESLVIDDNPIEDISPLKKLVKLKELDIGFTQVRDLSPIKGLDIRDLAMIETNVQNYDTLMTFPSLERFRVRYLNTQGLNTVSKLKTLRDLTIYNSDVSDLHILSGLVNLKNLDLNSNKVSSLAGVEKLKQLSHIGLGQNSLNDLSALYNIGGLRSIDITDASVADYSQLKNIHSLREIFCNGTQRQAIQEVIKDSNVKFTVQ